jgi:hypothetical protein
MGYWKNMDTWITGSLDTVKYGLLLLALHHLDLASSASFPTTHHVITLNPCGQDESITRKITWRLSQIL